MMRKSSRPNEAAYRRALKRLAWALKHPGDMSWQDRLPEAPPIPENPDETIALVIPKRPRRRSRRTRRKAIGRQQETSGPARHDLYRRGRRSAISEAEGADTRSEGIRERRCVDNVPSEIPLRRLS